jgi:hypothetical protein
MTNRQHIIHAVHDYDLEQFWKNLGILEAIQKGQAKCAICGSVINKDNFQCAYSIHGTIEICCDKLECFQEALERRKKQKVA